MSDCQKNQERLSAFLGGEITDDAEARMKEHLERCPKCRKDMDDIQRIMAGAEALHKDIEKARDTVDWEALARRITDAAFARKEKASPESKAAPFWKVLFEPKWRPVFAGVLAGILLGSVATFLLLKPGLFHPTSRPVYSASSDFIDRVELQLAKRETLDYLEKSQYLILDFVQSPPGRARLLSQDLAAQWARDMLSRKRYINQHLDKMQMAKAREICNQIELLFLELSQISDEISAEEIGKIQKFIDQKQILLKIQLIKKELESEV